MSAKPLLNLYRRRPLYAKLPFRPRPNSVFCCHHCRLYCVGLVWYRTLLCNVYYFPCKTGHNFSRPRYPNSSQSGHPVYSRMPLSALSAFRCVSYILLSRSSRMYDKGQYPGILAPLSARMYYQGGCTVRRFCPSTQP